MTEYPSTKKEALASGQKYYFTGKPCKRGHLSLRTRSGCLECLREKARSSQEVERKQKWKEENKDLQRAYKRKYKKRYHKTPEGRRKLRARHALQMAVVRGSIVKPARCKRCGAASDDIEGHHKDYDKPKDVGWVCRSCHREIHSNGEDDAD